MQKLIRRAAFPVLAVCLGGCAAADTSAPVQSSSANASARALVSDGEEGGYRGRLLLADDFNEAPINLRKWTVITDLPDWGHAVVVIEGGRVRFMNSGYLVTAAEFSPRELGGIRITGEWTYGSGYEPDDFLHVVTRSDGVPDPANGYDETREGIDFYATQLWGDANIMRITGRGGAVGTVTGLSNPRTLVLASGRTYRFDIRDDGRNLRFTMTDVLDPTNTRTITAKSLYIGASNHVAIHNRHYYYGIQRLSFLDNIRIERIPR